MAEYWLVNLADQRLEVYRNPRPDESQEFGFRYADLTVLQPGDTIAPSSGPGAAIPVAELLP